MSVKQGCGTCQAAVHGTSNLRERGLAVVHLSDGFNLSRAQGIAVHVATLDHECLVVLTEFLQRLSSINGFALDECHSGGTGEEIIKTFNASFTSSQLDHGVLGDGVLDISAKLTTQLSGLSNSQATVLGQHNSVGFLETLFQLGHCSSVLSICHYFASFLINVWCSIRRGFSP